MSKQQFDLNLINNLAREKFGTPPPKVEEAIKNRNSSLIPRSRQVSEKVVSDHEPVNSTLMDGVSSLVEQPKFSDPFANLKPSKLTDTNNEMDISQSKELDINTIISQSNMSEKQKSKYVLFFTYVR